MGDEAENEWDIASRWDTCTVYITTNFIFIYIYMICYLLVYLFIYVFIYLFT